MKKVLIITYYWPPSGGAGVQRWLKFSKYLPKNGWQPIVYTPENPDFSLQDSSLEKDIPNEAVILKTKIWEPYSLYKSLLGKKGESANAGFFASDRKSWKQKLSIYIRGNFFIPDPRVFWVKPSIKYLLKYLKDNPVDAIVSTGPPHSMHLIALGIKKKNPGLKWIADFRDPWTDIDFYNELNLSLRSDRKHHKLEEVVVNNASKVVTVSDNWAKKLEQNYNREINVITNGFDKDDFKEISGHAPSEITLVHLGSMNKDRNPHSLWKLISDLKKEKVFIYVELIGSIDETVVKSINENEIKDQVHHIPYLNHEEALKKASEASCLLLCVNNTPNLMGVIPGKLFEYLALNKPILNIGPVDGDSAKIISDTNSGTTVDFKSIEDLKTFLLDLKPLESRNVAKYSRENLTKRMTDLLNE